MFSITTKIMAGIIVTLLIGTSFLYWRLDVAQEAITQLKVEVAIAVDSIDTLVNELEVQTGALQTQAENNKKITAENKRYLDIFKRHDLTKLAAVKPGLIEKRINNGTKEVFDELENDSNIISGLDD